VHWGAKVTAHWGAKVTVHWGAKVWCTGEQKFGPKTIYLQFAEKMQSWNFNAILWDT